MLAAVRHDGVGGGIPAARRAKHGDVLRAAIELERLIDSMARFVPNDA